MKKTLTLALAMLLMLSLCACGAKETPVAPDLSAYYGSFMESLGEENQPAMMDVTDDVVSIVYPGLENYELRQSVLKTAAITAVPFEFALVECSSAEDAAAVKEIFETRVNTQIEGGAFYPATIAAWEKADVLTSGNVVALIVAGDSQESATEQLKALLG